MHLPMHSHLKDQKNIVLMYSPTHSHIQKKNKVICIFISSFSNQKWKNIHFLHVFSSCIHLGIFINILK